MLDRRIIEKVENFLYSRGLSELKCPTCDFETSPSRNQQVLHCPRCGLHASRLEWNSATRSASIGKKPAKTKIEEKHQDGVKSWLIPPRWAFWALLHIVFGGILVGAPLALLSFLLFGEVTFEHDKVSSLLIASVFCIPVLAGGGVVLWLGLSAKFTWRHLSISGSEISLSKRFFGRISEKVIHRHELNEVVIKKAYTRNSQAVHELHIKGSRGTIKLGSNLRPAEADWLCRELQEAWEPLRPQQTLKDEVLDHVESDEEIFPQSGSWAVQLPKAGNLPAIIGLIVTFIGAVGLAISIASDFGVSSEFGTLFWFFELPFLIMDVTIFVLSSILSVLGVLLLWHWVKMRSRERYLEKIDKFLFYRENKNGFVLAQEKMSVANFKDLRFWETGDENGTTKFRLELVGTNQVIPLARWLSEEDATELQGEIKSKLGLS